MASVFPKPDMNYIGKVLSDLLSQQLGEEIVITFTPKEGVGKEAASGGAG